MIIPSAWSLTLHFSPGDQEEYRAAGVDELLTKPIVRADLYRTSALPSLLLSLHGTDSDLVSSCSANGRLSPSRQERHHRHGGGGPRPCLRRTCHATCCSLDKTRICLSSQSRFPSLFLLSCVSPGPLRRMRVTLNGSPPFSSMFPSLQSHVFSLSLPSHTLSLSLGSHISSFQRSLLRYPSRSFIRTTSYQHPISASHFHLPCGALQYTCVPSPCSLVPIANEDFHQLFP